MFYTPAHHTQGPTVDLPEDSHNPEVQVKQTSICVLVIVPPIAPPYRRRHSGRTRIFSYGTHWVF